MRELLTDIVVLKEKKITPWLVTPVCHHFLFGYQEASKCHGHYEKDLDIILSEQRSEVFVYGFAMGALSVAFRAVCFFAVRKACPGKGPAVAAKSMKTLWMLRTRRKKCWIVSRVRR